MSISVEQLYAQRQAKFVESRTIIESELNKFLRSLEQLDAVHQQQLGVVPGQTARDVIPALWEEPFNEAAYTAQRAEADRRIAAAKQLCDQLNTEALKCLQEQ